MARFQGDWLRDQALALLRFHANSRNPAGGFWPLDRQGAPVDEAPRGSGSERPLHETSRMVHSYALAVGLGFPGARDQVDHGIAWLFDGHLDRSNGGFYWSVDDAGPIDSRKQAYGHAFVLLAAASAARAGHPDAARLRDRVWDDLMAHFWEADAGMVADTFSADWSEGYSYRGQNANMHLTEALMAAHAAWGDAQYLEMAEGIARRLIDKHARAAGWVVPEHFTEDWQEDPDFDGDPMFRPSGTTPGHALEWSRLLLELWEATGRRHEWMPEASEGLFRRAMKEGWLPTGGIAYTLGPDGEVSRDWRFWWPCAEAIGAAHRLHTVTGDAFYAEWYARVWEYVDARHIDHVHGGWFHQIDENGEPVAGIFPGKPDIYHALQACLIPLGDPFSPAG
ncbi:Mannose or cellobiose epimerase, N-acyl-D-glucosamine 2-epimerase family [Poseidonocella pacifica]|uniref:Mannose or cellobiose epimerase, N-acyl-D-glucosamine 2-epimerase family n=1 Tax=Poseidonocella pacifica TaxID=871651 RepID=A0A1I0V543_9RHOB|nr:AGE family epimerase/isomerase [Poseidonocella pacifica]SFA71200.1 Mannose or cellobiose epimerase, N-acyl-D-glucosamine 2-epimerase family [Poseidonocella pacifica]